MKQKGKVGGVFPPLTVKGRLFPFELENEVFQKAPVCLVNLQMSNYRDFKLQDD